VAERKSKSAELVPEIGTKIVVVDDDEVILKLVSKVLCDQGYQVSPFTDARKALRKIQEKEYDLMVADIKMPEIDGIELVKRAHQVSPNLGALFMTGFASVETAKEAVKEGAFDYILKPFDLEEMKVAVAKALDKRKEILGKVKTGDLAWLYDLNKLLSSTMDRKGLLKLLLGLGLSHCKLTNGSILIWDHPLAGLEIFVIQNLGRGEFKEERLKISKETADSWSKIAEPVKEIDITRFPIYQYLENQQTKPDLFSEIFPPKDRIISIPIQRGEKLVGFLNLNQKKDQNPPDPTKMKLIKIVATQTAISLENLRLFQKTQESYLKLQGLQDQIVALEKGAIEAHRSAQIGHDINNFLMIIKGYFQLLPLHLEKNDKAKIEKCVKAVEEHLTKAETFVKSLMDFRSMKGKKEGCDVNGLIEKVVSFLKPQKRFQYIGMTSSLDRKAPLILADSNQLQQLFYNLLNNGADAIRSLGKADGDIEIRTGFNEKENLLEIKISDSGKGMSEEELKKAFQVRFTTKEHGHGLGLLACKKIIEDHRGGIEVKSRIGEGTQFTIKLPYQSSTSP